MDVKGTLQQQMQALHATLEAAIGDCPADALTRKLPGSTINSIGAIYAHTIFSEDGILNALVRGGTPVYFAGGWAPQGGLYMPHVPPAAVKPTSGKGKALMAGGPVEDWATDYDIFDPAYIRDPFPVWDELRQQCPVAHTA